MRLHRFFVSPDQVELKQSVWIKDQSIRNQWQKVLRYNVGQQVVLFDGEKTDRLYKIVMIEPDAIKLELVTEFERQLPDFHLYLMFSLLKKDKNDWVLQKATELGVTHFVPIIADRSEKLGFNHDRASRIIIEAAEQCGRSDIPVIREPINIQTALDDYTNMLELYVAEHGSGTKIDEKASSRGIFIGPEGGWTDKEKKLFDQYGVKGVGLGRFILRAETACVVAVAKLLNV
jgi:16S rRNA (uracil1498-N3)-methyltransferase